MIQQTSLLSFNEIRQNSLVLTQSYREILQALSLTQNMTDREIADFLNYSDPNKIRPRRNELVKYGYVVEYSKRVCSITGKYVIAWKLSQ